jgi:hypothetical protein
MFNKLFGGGKKEESNPAVAAFKQQLDTLEQRWYSFLGKLEEKYDELVTAIETEGPKTYLEDTDPYKRAFYRFQSGMNGQLDGIRKKAYDTCDVQIRDFYASNKPAISDPAFDLLHNWRNRCMDAHSDWEERIEAKKSAVWESVKIVDDPEVKYAAILAEYDHIKDKFTCKQCGSPLTIDKIFFISTYITCPACQTQNTFEPSTQARGLEHLARELAEKRTASLLAAYNAEKNLEHELYNEIHQTKYSNLPDAAKKTKIAELENRMKQAAQDAPDMYRRYLRAMFDEWNKIIPDLKEQNEKFYERQLADFNKMND